ncbi:TetR/AcrR family transcriptional regulator [Tenggerimyces flavus]|uniref:TetR/AcrR family transcriptional regulator n=1 Tax=Tenggerimyces flavus TaxID=1708749 RepID=A0ABV7YJF1_9ACTN|nr:TetR/AcrR family transcriptional regulator [Tenggerimyces flavus]MBM7787675.1 TetR/AcrR family transcriptional repressor of mexJK operon [Tenggerimyces flavus]
MASDDEVLLVRVGPPPQRGESRTRRDSANDPRRIRTRAAIVEAATSLFLEKGYRGTSLDDIAALAAVSKRTVYNNFADKDRLFTEIIGGVAASAEALAQSLTTTIAGAADLPAVLREAARGHIRAVLRPQILQLRRLLISEANRFPDLARDCYLGVPGRVMTAIADAFTSLASRGLLRIADPARAAEHYSFLLLGAALDRAMLGLDPVSGASEAEREGELDRIADDAVATFLAAYGAQASA